MYLFYILYFFQTPDNYKFVISHCFHYNYFISYSVSFTIPKSSSLLFIFIQLFFHKISIILWKKKNSIFENLLNMSKIRKNTTIKEAAMIINFCSSCMPSTKWTTWCFFHVSISCTFLPMSFFSSWNLPISVFSAPINSAFWKSSKFPAEHLEQKN